MVILVVFKGFLFVKNLEILIQIVPERPIYYYYDEAVREIRERIKELIDDGVKVNNFDEMKKEIIDHVKKTKRSRR